MTRYWVGGDGNWSQANYHWSDTSGGTPNASFLPTSADDVIFDANSNSGTSAFIVYVDGNINTPSLCQDFSTSSLDGVMTLQMGATSALYCYGSLTLPATNFTWTSAGGSLLNFLATTTGKTVTTNGVSLGTLLVVFLGNGGEWTLGSALTTISFTYPNRGIFNTNNFNITTAGFIRDVDDSATTVNLGSSVITCNSPTPSVSILPTNLTFNAGTSNIICTSANATFTGGGLTYNNVEFSGGAGTKTINDANTFNGQFLVSNAAATTVSFTANQTFTGGALFQATAPTTLGGVTLTGTCTFTSAAHGIKSFGSQTYQNLTITCPAVDGTTPVYFNGTTSVTGTLTTTNGGSTARRVLIQSNVSGTQRTLSVGTNSLVNTDFRDIIAAGTASWSFGLGYGDLGNNTGITFDSSTLYWIGGTGNWSSTTNWSTSSGGSAANAVPCFQNSVIFDAASNVGTGTFTVTGNAAMQCNDFSTGGAGGALDGAMTLSLPATAVLSCYGSMTLPATNLTWAGTGGAVLNFIATTTGKTVTTNGVTITATLINFNGIGGEWTLGSAISTGTNMGVVSGSFVTNNFNITANQFNSNSGNTRSVTLGSSTITLSATQALVFTSTNLTFNAGTSQITCTIASPTFTGGGLTYNNLTFSNTAIGTVTILGSNTYNNLTFAARASAGVGQTVFDGGGTNTINGTLTLNSGTIGTSRLFVRASVVGVTTTLSVATLAAMTDIDFRDITAAGTASPFSGTRIGNCLGNSNITFTAARTVYWVSAASANWNNAVWGTSSGTTGGATTNLPLAQDTIVIDNAGLTTGNTITFVNAYNIGTLDFSSRSNAATFATGVGTPTFYNDYVLSSAITVSGTGVLNFAKQSETATITSAAKTFTQPITINAPSGTVRINGNLTIDSVRTTTLTQGTLDLTNGGAGNFTLSTGAFSSTNSNTRSITFGTGDITLTNNGVSIFNMTTATNFTYTGTPTVNATYSGSTGTRTLTLGNSAGGSETNCLNFIISAGSDTINIGGSRVLNLNFTGFTGAWTNTALPNIFGDLTLTSSMNCAGTTSTVTFSKTTGIQTITTNGNTTINFPINIDAPGATVQLQDNLTIGSTRTFTLTNGTLDLNDKTLSTGLFNAANANTNVIAFGTGNITVTGNNATVFTTAGATGLSVTGTAVINATYSGAVGQRTLNSGIALSEANSMSFNISAGSDIVAVGTVVKNLNFTGFSGTYNNTAKTCYGNVIFSSGMTLEAGTSVFNFNATSGTQQITTSAQTLDFPLTFDGIGGTFAFQDALTQGSTRAFTITNGTLQFKNATTNVVGNFTTTGTNLKYLQSTVSGTQATISQASGTARAGYLNIKDSNATGGAIWLAEPTSVNGGNTTGWFFLSPDNGNFFLLF